MTTTPLTQEEKIDAIYLMMKSSEKRAKMQIIYKVLFWVAMFAYSYYFMVYTLPTLMKSFIPNIPGLSQNAEQDSSNPSSTNDQMKALLDSYLKR